LGKSRSSPSIPERQALLIPSVSRIFQELRVGAAIFQDGYWPELIHAEDGLITFEMDYGLQGDRYGYNERCFDRVRRTRASLVARHGGLHDLFVPILIRGKAEAILATGPFMTARPTHRQILERWRALSGRQGHHADPKFARYLSLTLSTLVLDGEGVRKFRLLIEHLARLISQGGGPDAVRAEVEALMLDLVQARFAERLWELIRQLLDDRTSRAGSSASVARQFSDFGVKSIPEHVAVGLLVRRRKERDFVEELLRRHAFQHACVELGRERGNLACGALGDHGVVFLHPRRGPAGRRRLVALAETAAAIASKRFGLKLHIGVSALEGAIPLQYRAALSAASAALAEGKALITGANAGSFGTALGELRSKLARLAEENPGALPAHYDHFIEAVALRSGQGLDVARVHLDVAFEEMARTLLRSGLLESKDFEAQSQALTRASDQAMTPDELFAVHRQAVLDIADAVERPEAARHDRSLRRAQEYLLEHYTERVSLKQVARVAGFAPTYFSSLFHEKVGQTFADHVRHLRLERAKHLLSSTKLDLQRIGELSGLSTRQYLIRAFKRWVGSTPAQYRARSLGTNPTSSLDDRPYLSEYDALRDRSRRP